MVDCGTDREMDYQTKSGNDDRGKDMFEASESSPNLKLRRPRHYKTYSCNLQ